MVVPVFFLLFYKDDTTEINAIFCVYSFKFHCYTKVVQQHYFSTKYLQKVTLRNNFCEISGFSINSLMTGCSLILRKSIDFQSYLSFIFKCEFTQISYFFIVMKHNIFYKKRFLAKFYHINPIIKYQQKSWKYRFFLWKCSFYIFCQSPVCFFLVGVLLQNKINYTGPPINKQKNTRPNRYIYRTYIKKKKIIRLLIMKKIKKTWFQN